MHPALNKVHVQHRGQMVAVWYIAMRDENENGDPVFWWKDSRGREMESDNVLDSPWYTDDQQAAEEKAIELFGETPGRRILKGIRSLVERLLK